jgi:phosphoenolpyruvate carboxykinase (ATP)
MSLPHARALITAALGGKLNNMRYTSHPVFGVSVPQSCEGVPSDILDPRNTWADKNTCDAKANELAIQFNKNFKKYAS